jgi:hypothetical protein
VVLDRGIAPVLRGVQRAGRRVPPLRKWRLQLYLLGIVATVSALLIYLAAVGGGQ